MADSLFFLKPGTTASKLCCSIQLFILCQEYCPGDTLIDQMLFFSFLWRHVYKAPVLRIQLPMLSDVIGT